MVDDAQGRGGRLRRLIDLDPRGSDQVVAWVEDDFHHFGLTIHHDGHTITDVSGIAERAPWTTCFAAPLKLRGLVGRTLMRRASEIGALIDMRDQCTHLFDLAGLAIAHAAQGRPHRRYEAIVPDITAEKSRDGITLSQDGVVVMEWSVTDRVIVAPDRYAGHGLDQGFRAWTETMGEDEAEYAFILRRAVMVSSGRAIDLDRLQRADQTGMGAVCHTFQPENRLEGLRIIGATRNYEAGSGGMLGVVDKTP